MIGNWIKKQKDAQNAKEPCSYLNFIAIVRKQADTNHGVNIAKMKSLRININFARRNLIIKRIKNLPRYLIAVQDACITGV